MAQENREVQAFCRQLEPLKAQPVRPVASQSNLNTSEVGAAAERLSLFLESKGNLKAHLKRSGDFSPSAAQAADIAACLRQSRELLRVSRSAELIALPVTLYYAMASLAAALALSYGEPRRLANFPQRHGLLSCGLEQPLPDVQIKVSGDDGLFHRFAESISQSAGLLASVRDGGKIWIETGRLTRDGLPLFSASLKELLARVVGLVRLYEATFEQLACVVAVDLHLGKIKPASEWPPIASFVFHAREGIDHDWVVSLHPRLRQWAWREREDNFGDAEKGVVVFENLPPDLTPRPRTEEDQGPVRGQLSDLLIPTTRSLDGVQYVLGSIGDVTSLEPVIQLAAAYLLSTIARYRPDRWAEFCFDPSAEGYRLRALLDAFFEGCLTVFPLQVLAALGRIRDAADWSGRQMPWRSPWP